MRERNTWAVKDKEYMEKEEGNKLMINYRPTLCFWGVGEGSIDRHRKKRRKREKKKSSHFPC